MARNGERHPPRPRIELLTEVEPEADAAAIVAALERFMADTAPARPEATPGLTPWQRAALREGVSRSAPLAWGPRSG
jgi:hypothetical protein